MKFLTLENLNKAINLVKSKGYDDKHTEQIVLDIFDIVEKHGKTAEFYIDMLPVQN